jgi:hypothetical protein
LDQSLACCDQSSARRDLARKQEQRRTLFSLIRSAASSDVGDVNRLHLECFDEAEKVIRHCLPCDVVQSTNEEDGRDGAECLDYEKDSLSVRFSKTKE